MTTSNGASVVASSVGVGAMFWIRCTVVPAETSHDWKSDDALEPGLPRMPMLRCWHALASGSAPSPSREVTVSAGASFAALSEPPPEDVSAMLASRCPDPAPAMAWYGALFVLPHAAAASVARPARANRTG